MPAVVISASIAVIYLADRTGFWLKEQKQFNPYTFAFLSLLCLTIGLLTVKRSENDLGFLNREQTDEWKGWMQSKFAFYLTLPRADEQLHSRHLDIPLHWFLEDIWHI